MCIRDSLKRVAGIDASCCPHCRLGPVSYTHLEQKYTLNSLPGKFSGMHLVSIMYAGMKAIDPDMDAGVDLSAEYAAAMAMRGKR